MTVLDRLPALCHRLWPDGEERAGRLPLGVVAAWLVLVAALIGLVLACGPLAQVTSMDDVAAYLDGASRVWAGQHIHRDFFSPLGVVAFLPFAFGMHIAGPNAWALPVGVCLWIAAISFWSLQLAWTRLPRLPALVFSLVPLLLAGSSYMLGFSGWGQASYSLYYNRMAWCLFALAALESWLPPRQPGTSATPGALSTGSALALLLLLKVNFFLGTGLLVAVATWMRGAFSVHRFRDLILGFAGTFLVVALIGRVDVPAFWHEMRALSAVNTPDAFLPVAAQIADRNSGLILLTAVTALLVGFGGTRVAAPDDRQACQRAATALLVTAGAGLLISLANCQYDKLPSFPLGFLLVGALLPPATLRTRPLLRIAGLLGCLLYVLPLAGFPLRSLIWQSLHGRDAGQVAFINTPALADLPCRRWLNQPTSPEAVRIVRENQGDSCSPYLYALWLQDGLDLVRPQLTTAPRTRVASLDWINPFPFALGLPPPAGDHIAWHYGRVMNDVHHPDADVLLAGTDLVMEPLFSTSYGVLDFKRRLFSALLARDFELIGESRFWKLWRRKPERAQT